MANCFYPQLLVAILAIICVPPLVVSVFRRLQSMCLRVDVTVAIRQSPKYEKYDLGVPLVVARSLPSFSAVLSSIIEDYTRTMSRKT